jgi:hypothetical protein
MIRHTPTPLLFCCNLGVVIPDLREGNRGAILGAVSTGSHSFYTPINRHFLRRFMAVGLGEEVRGDLFTAQWRVGREFTPGASRSMAPSRSDYDSLIVMSISTKRQPSTQDASGGGKFPHRENNISP